MELYGLRREKGMGKNMILTDKEVNQFYIIYDPTIRRCKSQIPINSKALRNDLSRRLTSNQSSTNLLKIIGESIRHEFIESRHKTMNGNEITLVNSWKRIIHGKFIINRHFKERLLYRYLWRIKRYTCSRDLFRLGGIVKGSAHVTCCTEDASSISEIGRAHV